MLAVESRSSTIIMSKKQQQQQQQHVGSLMEAFDVKDRKSAARRNADLILVRKKNASEAVRSSVTVETTVVVEVNNGGANTTRSQDPVVASSSSLSPEQPSKTVPSAAPSTFGKVKISLENLILPDYRLYPTPSMSEGLDSRTEWHLRRLGCDFIQHAGILLKLPQVCFSLTNFFRIFTKIL